MNPMKRRSLLGLLAGIPAAVVGYRWGKGQLDWLPNPPSLEAQGYEVGVDLASGKDFIVHAQRAELARIHAYIAKKKPMYEGLLRDIGPHLEYKALPFSGAY